jgi:hypothetical protein
MASWVERYIQARPTELRPTIERVEVPGAICPECGGGDIRRYPVANSLGARIVTKCQDCLHRLAMDRPTDTDNWPAFRAVTYDWPASPAERAARDRLLIEMAEA